MYNNGFRMFEVQCFFWRAITNLSQFLRCVDFSKLNGSFREDIVKEIEFQK